MHHGEQAATAVDLYLPALDTAVELDPWSSHSKKTESDRSRLAALRETYGRVVRVREDPLPTLPGCITVPSRAAVLVWATRATESLGAPLREVSDDDVLSALALAACEWDSVLTTPPSPSLDDYPILADEFVANVTYPGKVPKWIAAGSGDIVTWRCTQCSHSWNTQVAHRTGPNPTGCKPCAVARRSAAGAIAPAGRRIIDLAPRLIEEFVANLDMPGASIETAFSLSRHRCLWRCTYCGKEWQALIQARFKHSHTGCQACNSQKAWDNGVRTSAVYDAQWDAAYAVLVAFHAREGHACPPLDHEEGGFPLGKWVGSQRKRRSALSESRVARLETLSGWVWNTREAAWESGYASLLSYVEHEGHANVPFRHVERGHRLGAWVVHQRQSRGRLTVEQSRRLSGLPGWRWEGKKERGRTTLADGMERLGRSA
jgi:hypothetical protein